MIEPRLGLLGVAFWAAAIAAGVIGEHLGVTCLAAPDLPAKRCGSAVENILDGTSMRGWHRRAMNREIARREAAEHLGEFDHDRASKAGHQSIKQTV